MSPQALPAGGQGCFPALQLVTHRHRHNTRRSRSPARPRHRPYSRKPTPAWAAGATAALPLSLTGKGHTAPTTAPTATAGGGTRLPPTVGVLGERKVPVFTRAGHHVPCSHLICLGAEHGVTAAQGGREGAPAATTAFRLLEQCRGPDSL